MTLLFTRIKELFDEINSNIEEENVDITMKCIEAWSLLVCVIRCDVIIVSDLMKIAPPLDSIVCLLVMHISILYHIKCP